MIFNGASIANKKVVKLTPGPNLLTDSPPEFQLGLGQYLLTFAAWDADAIVTSWNNSANAVIKEIRASTEGAAVVFTSTKTGEDFELTCTLSEGSAYSSAAWELTFQHTPTGGTFTLTIQGSTTGNITYSATPATLITNITNAINAMVGFTSGDVVTTHAAGIYTLDFSQGKFATSEVSDVQVDFTLLTGGDAAVTVTQVQDGNAGQHEIIEISVPADGTHSEDLNDKQTLTPAGNTEGTFTIEVPTLGTTTSIPFNAGRSLIKTKLETAIGVGNVKVTGGPLALSVPGGDAVEVDGVLTNDAEYALDNNVASFTDGGDSSGLLLLLNVGDSRTNLAFIRFTLAVAPTDEVVNAIVSLTLGGNASAERFIIRASTVANGSWPANLADADNVYANQTTASVDQVVTGMDGDVIYFNVTDLILELQQLGSWSSGDGVILIVSMGDDNTNASLDSITTAPADGSTLSVSVIPSSSFAYYPVHLEFIGDLAGQDIDEVVVATTTLDGTITPSTDQEGGSTTVSNVTGGSLTLVMTRDAVNYVAVIPYDSTAGEVETIIEATGIGGVTASDGPLPGTPVEVEFGFNDEITSTIYSSLEGNFDSSITTELIRAARAPVEADNVWDITIVPGEGTLAVDGSIPQGYVIIRIAEPINESLVVSSMGAENDIFVKLEGINALRIQNTINEAFARDIVRVTRITHSQEWNHVVVGSASSVSEEEDLYFWYFRDVYRLVFCNEFQPSATIESITVTTPPTSEGNTTPAGPDVWMIAPTITDIQDVPDVYREAGRVYEGFTLLYAAGQPVHEFSAVRYEDTVDNHLVYKFKLLSQYGLNDTATATRTGIAKQLVDQKITFSWVRQTWSGDIDEIPTQTVLASTSPLDWDSSPETIQAALSSMLTGQGSLIANTGFLDGSVEVTGTLFNSYLSESDTDLPDELDSYNDLRVKLTGKLAHLPLNEVDYALVCTISSILISNTAVSKDFRVVGEPYSVPLPRYFNQRTRLSISSLDGISSLKLGVGTTLVTIPLDSTAAQISSLLNDAIGSIAGPVMLPEKFLNSVSVYGTDLSGPIDFEFSGYGLQYTDQTLLVTSIAVGTSPVLLTTTQEGVTARPEIQSITIPSGIRSGNFTLTLSGETSGNIAFNADAAAISTIINAAWTPVWTVAGTGPFVLTSASNVNYSLISSTDTFNNGTASVEQTLFGGLGGTFTFEEVTKGRGPSYYDDPFNWDGQEVPGSGASSGSPTQVILDDALSPIKYGIDQTSIFLPISIGDSSEFVHTRLRKVFENGQRVLFREEPSTSGGIAPSGLTFDTLYYIVNAEDNRFQLSATLDGTPIALASVGEGTFQLLTVNLDILIYARFAGGAFGLPNYRAGNMLEYLSRYFKAGLINLEIGIEAGDGLSLGRFNLLDFPSIVQIHRSGTGSFPIPALLFLFDNEDAEFHQELGDSGIAVYAGESSTLKLLDVESGSLKIANTTVIDTVNKQEGATITILESSVGGTVNFS